MSYPKSIQLSSEELEYFCYGIRLVSKEIEKYQTAPYLIIALRSIQFSDCNIQEEAFAASAMEWTSEIFGFPMPEIRAYFEQNSNSPYGRYVYDFTAKIAFDVYQVRQDLEDYKEQYQLQISSNEMLISGRSCTDIKCGDKLFTTEGKSLIVKKILAYGHTFDVLPAGMTCIILTDKIEHSFRQFEKLYFSIAYEGD